MAFLQFLMDIGVYLMPFALLLYFPFRWIEYYTAGSKFYQLYNFLLYTLLWFSYETESAGGGTVISLLAMILFWDGIFLYFEKQRTKEEEDQEWKHHTEKEYNHTPEKRPKNDSDPETNQEGTASD